MSGLEKKLCEHLVQSKFLFNEKNTIRKKSMVFVKLFVWKMFFGKKSFSLHKKKFVFEKEMFKKIILKKTVV